MHKYSINETWTPLRLVLNHSKFMNPILFVRIENMHRIYKYTMQVTLITLILMLNPSKFAKPFLGYNREYA